MRVLVCGGRDFSDKTTVWGWMQALHLKLGVSVVIHGDASGADRLAASWARQEGVPVIAYPAAWQTHGRAAGPIRNQQMLDFGKPDLVIAFPGGRGTADMVGRARKAGIKVVEISSA